VKVEPPPSLRFQRYQFAHLTGRWRKRSYRSELRVETPKAEEDCHRLLPELARRMFRRNGAVDIPRYHPSRETDQFGESSLIAGRACLAINASRVPQFGNVVFLHWLTLRGSLTSAWATVFSRAYDCRNGGRETVWIFRWQEMAGPGQNLETGARDEFGDAFSGRTREEGIAFTPEYLAGDADPWKSRLDRCVQSWQIAQAHLEDIARVPYAPGRGHQLAIGGERKV
jgi:hypothetical protein